MRFRLPYTLIYPWQHTNNTRPTDWKLRDGGKPLQLVVICSRIHIQYNVQVGCYLFHSIRNLTMYFSGLPTSFRNHLPLLFHTTKSWTNKHLSQVATDPKHANQWALYPICHSLAHSKNADTSWSTVMLPMNPRKYDPGCTFKYHAEDQKQQE